MFVSAFVAIVAVVALLVPMPFHSRVGDCVFDIMHLPTFAILSWLALAISDYFVSTAIVTRFLTILAVVFCSACIELLQSKTGRSASIHDLVANSGGAITALLIHSSVDGQPITKCLAYLGAIAICIGVTTGPVLSLMDVARQERSPAILASFESNAELERWYVDKTQLRIVATGKTPSADDSGYAMEAKLVPGRFPAVQLQQLNHDWTPYTHLVFELSRSATDDGGPIVIQLKIKDYGDDDERHTSYTQRYELLPGDSKPMKLRLADLKGVAANRPLNLSNIHFVEFFAIDLRQPATILVGNIRLLNGD